MVSVRKAWRRLMGLSPGQSSIVGPLLEIYGTGNGPERPFQNGNSVIVHPLPSSEVKQAIRDAGKVVTPGLPYVSATSSAMDQQEQQFSASGQGVKRRKQHRRKHIHDQEPCLMRGVYFKNMKWQAAIKVDKKQIHLGTVGTQEEAARLYDRAAFMCGREPNFLLSEEEKQELRKFEWDDFLAITRSAINNKKHQRRRGANLRKKTAPSQQSSDLDGDQEDNSLSASEDTEPEMETSA